MKKLLTLMAVLCPFVSSAQADKKAPEPIKYVVVDPVRIHNDRNITIIMVPVGDTILISSYNEDKCFLVNYKNIWGYTSEIWIKETEEIKKLKKSVITKATSTHSSSPASNQGSRQCSGYTQKGTQCKRMTTSANGRCYQH